MTIKSFVKAFIPQSLLDYRRRKLEDIREFHYDNQSAVAPTIREKYDYSGELLDLFVSNRDNIVHKWHHYIPLYDRYFSAYRGKQVRFLEIGVNRGGSLQLWRRYLGDDAIIFGIDINPECARFNNQAGQVRIGSQADASFLSAVVEEMGGLDVVLDDGSHQMAHIQTSLHFLFPHLAIGGIYMIEDLHAAYWKSFGGGYRSKQNFFRYLQNLVHDMHHWYHKKPPTLPEISTNLGGIHIHDSLVVLEKSKVHPPLHSQIG